jgi:hypothetical protein
MEWDMIGGGEFGIRNSEFVIEVKGSVQYPVARRPLVSGHWILASVMPLTLTVIASAAQTDNKHNVKSAWQSRRHKVTKTIKILSLTNWIATRGYYSNSC